MSEEQSLAISLEQKVYEMRLFIETLAEQKKVVEWTPELLNDYGLTSVEELCYEDAFDVIIDQARGIIERLDQ